MQLIVELLLTAAVILAILLICGVSWAAIQIGLMWGITGLVCGIALLFFVSMVFLIRGKRCNARFLRIDKLGRMGGHAVYLIDGEERTNWYPAEECFRRQIYRDHESKAVIWCKGKHYLLFDWYSMIIVAIGFPVFTFLAVGMLFFMLKIT